MRVISGNNRGLKLSLPDENITRTTLDRNKETIFNIIQFDVPKSTFLDLYSGSGSIGIEARSRGADKVYLNDLNKKALSVIIENVKKTKDEDGYEISNLDSNMLLTRLYQKKEKLDFIYIDPPFKYIDKLLKLNLEKIKNYGILKDDGVIICETPIDYKLEVCNEYYHIVKVIEFKNVKNVWIGRK